MSNKIAKLSRKRRLTDLYVRGKEVALTDDVEDEDPIVLWVSKISPLENKEAVDRASAHRAGILALKKLPPEDPTIFSYYEQARAAVEANRDAVVENLCSEKIAQSRLSHESELADKEEWKENNYLESLQEAWESEMKERLTINPEDPEANRVMKELERFADELDELIEADKSDYMEEVGERSDEELVRMTVEKSIEEEADFSWMIDYRKWQIFFAVRYAEDHNERYFVDKSEVDNLDIRVLRPLIEAFTEISVESMEGKDSEATPSS